MRRYIAWVLGPARHTRGIRLFRAACGAWLLLFALRARADAPALWGPHGLALPAAGSDIPTRAALAIGRIAFASDASTTLLIWLMAAAGLALLLNRAVLPATLAGLAALWAVMARFPMLAEGDYIAARLALTLLVPTSPGPAPAGSRRALAHNLAAAAILGQLAVAYLAAGIHKASGQAWSHGVALSAIDHASMFAGRAFHVLASSPAIAAALAYAVLLWELWLPVALLSPLRVPWVAFGLLIEIAIGATMHLALFAILMTGWLLAAVTDAEYEAAARAARRALAALGRALWPPRPSPAVTAYVDDSCAACSRAARLIAALDPARTVEIRSALADPLPPGVSRDDARAAMVAVDLATGAVARGADALLLVASTAALARPAAPALRLLARSRLGPAAYAWIATRRHARQAPACPARGTRAATGNFSRLQDDSASERR